MAKQKTIEDIREYMEAEGYTLLSDVYVNQETKMRIKTNYAKDNNIKLIRIPYWNYDEIETILDKQL